MIQFLLFPVPARSFKATLAPARRVTTMFTRKPQQVPHPFIHNYHVGKVTLAMTDKTWVQFYFENTGKLGRVFGIDVDELCYEDIHDLRTHVYNVMEKHLGHCNSPNLGVYTPGIEFPPKEQDEMRPGLPIPENTTCENPIRVVAPAPVQQQGKIIFIMLHKFSCCMLSLLPSILIHIETLKRAFQPNCST